MNPPWVKIGRLFIDKAIGLLKPNGKLICIIGYNQFANTSGKPGTFNYLQKLGYFQRIEVFKGQTPRDYFKGRGDWCWFIFINSKAKSTTIVNRLGETFEYKFKGNEYYVPQIPNETDYFDWDDGTPHKTVNANSISKFKGSYISLRQIKSSIKNIDKGEFILNKGMIFENMSKYTLEKLHKEIPLYQLYADSKSGDKLRCPPIKKELQEMIKEYDGEG